MFSEELYLYLLQKHDKRTAKKWRTAKDRLSQPTPNCEPQSLKNRVWAELHRHESSHEAAAQPYSPDGACQRCNAHFAALQF